MLPQGSCHQSKDNEVCDTVGNTCKALPMHHMRLDYYWNPARPRLEKIGPFECFQLSERKNVALFWFRAAHFRNITEDGTKLYLFFLLLETFRLLFPLKILERSKYITQKLWKHKFERLPFCCETLPFDGAGRALRLLLYLFVAETKRVAAGNSVLYKRGWIIILKITEARTLRNADACAQCCHVRRWWKSSALLAEGGCDTSRGLFVPRIPDWSRGPRNLGQRGPPLHWEWVRSVPNWAINFPSDEHCLQLRNNGRRGLNLAPIPRLGDSLSHSDFTFNATRPGPSLLVTDSKRLQKGKVNNAPVPRNVLSVLYCHSDFSSFPFFAVVICTFSLY